MRIDTITKTFSAVPSSVDTTNTAGSASNTANGYTSHESTTTARIALKTGSRADTYRYYCFDTSEIPDGVTIISVSCLAKAYISNVNTSYVTSRKIQMYSNLTPKGTAQNLTTTTTTFNFNDGTWTLEELRNARVGLTATRGTSSTTSSIYIYFYGATLTVQYSYQSTVYEVTLNNNSSYTVTLNPSGEVEAGNTVRLIVPDIENVIVKDNGTNVNNSFVEYDIFEYTGTPSSVTTNGTISGTNYNSAIGKDIDAENGFSSSDYATNSNSTCYVEYSFNFSSIPANAIIQNVQVLVLGHLQSTSQSQERAELQLYTGSTTKGSSISFTFGSNKVIEMPATTWTRSELQSAKLRFTMGHYGGAICGVSFIVTYQGDATPRLILQNLNADHSFVITDANSGDILYVKVNNTWTKIDKAYRKINGAWVQEDDLKLVFDSNNQYIKGNIS